jgi:hypothetical protein
MMNFGSSVSTVSDYRLDDRGSILGRGRASMSGARPTSYPMGTGGPSPGGEARPGRGADHSHAFSAEVRNE